jgi:hypothetical protein
LGIPVVRPPPLPLPELLPNKELQLHQTVQGQSNLADSDREERESLFESGDELRGGEAGEGATVDKAATTSLVSLDDFHPELDLGEAQ